MYCLSKTPEVEPDFFKWSQDEKINFKNSKKILKNSKKISKIMFIILFNVADFIKIISLFFLFYKILDNIYLFNYWWPYFSIYFICIRI